jgi:hypothetical protein
VKERWKGTEEEEEDVSGYSMILRKRRYWNWRQKTPDCNYWRTFGTGYIPVARQTTE